MSFRRLSIVILLLFAVQVLGQTGQRISQQDPINAVDIPDDADVFFGVTASGSSKKISVAELKKLGDVRVVADVEAMKAVDDAKQGQVFQTLAYDDDHPGVGANLYRYTTGSGTDDAGFFLTATGMGAGGFEAVDQTVADVTQFGAVPDSSGSAAANNTAFAAACASNSKRTLLPSSGSATTTYYFNPGLVLPQGQILEGDSNLDVRLRPATQTLAADDFLTINSYCVVRDLALQGFPASGAQSLGDGLCTTSGSSRWKVNNVRCIQWGCGFHLINTWIGELSNCIGATCSEAALKTSGAEINQILITGGEYATSAACIKMTTGCNSVTIRSTIEGATATGDAYGIWLTGSAIYSSFCCENSYFEANKTHHIYADSNCVLFGGNITGNGFYADTANSSVKIARSDATVYGTNTFRYTPATGSHLELASLCINGIVFPQTDGQQVVSDYAIVSDAGKNRHIAGRRATAADGDATPAVNSLTELLVANTGATTITDFDDGVAGQSIRVHINDANTGISSSSELNLGAAGNYTAQAGGALFAFYTPDGATWYEVSRSVF